MDKINPPAVVIKRKPYPFRATLNINGVKKTVSVLLLNKTGVMARLESLVVQVGTRYEIQFELPVIGQWVLTPVRIIKTYDKVIESSVYKVDRLAEFRFEKLSEDHFNAIESFISKNGQKK